MVYTAMRILLFLASLGVIMGIWGLVSDKGVPLFWAVILAFLVSGIASYFILNRQRVAFARRVEERAAKASAAFEERKAREDRLRPCGAQNPVRQYGGSPRSAIAASSATGSSAPSIRPARWRAPTLTAPR